MAITAAERTRLWRLANPARAKAMCKEWRAKNPERAKVSSKKWRTAHPDKIRADRKKNAVRINENRKRRDAANPFRVKMYYVGRMLRRAGCAESEVQKAIEAWKVFDGICQGCGNACSSVWVTDHDHLKLVFRGIIGESCNHALGKAKDSPKRLRALAGYLERCV